MEANIADPIVMSFLCKPIRLRFLEINKITSVSTQSFVEMSQILMVLSREQETKNSSSISNFVYESVNNSAHSQMGIKPINLFSYPFPYCRTSLFRHKFDLLNGMLVFVVFHHTLSRLQIPESTRLSQKMRDSQWNRYRIYLVDGAA